MAYKERAPLVQTAIATLKLNRVFTLASQESLTTQNLGTPAKNTVGHR